MRKYIKTKFAQATIEFTFSFILMLILFYGIIQAIRWTGVTLAERRIQHEQSFKKTVGDNWKGYDNGPMQQIRSDFYQPKRMDLIFK